MKPLSLISLAGRKSSRSTEQFLQADLDAEEAYVEEWGASRFDWLLFEWDQNKSTSDELRTAAVEKIPHAECFASTGSDSLIGINSFFDVVSGPSSCPSGKKLKRGSLPVHYYRQGHSPLLRPSVREYRLATRKQKKSGPQRSLVSDFHLAGLCLPNEKEFDMSQYSPFKFLLSG